MNPIRIRTTIGKKRVSTIYHNGKWVTMATGLGSLDASDMLQAGLNHLQLAKNLDSTKDQDAD